jgi:hypothetical protein
MIHDALTDYLDSVRQGWDDLCAARQPLAPIDLADGSRYLAAITEGALTFVHADPAAPAFVPWTTPDRRWSDNGADAAYWMAPVDGNHRYRIQGTRLEECYLSFTVYAGTPGHPERVVSNVNHRALGAGNHAVYDLVVEPPADACYVIARQYFLDPAHDVPATMRIDVVDGPPPTVPTDEQIAARWRAAAGFVEAMTRPPARGLPAFAAAEVNTIGPPTGWTAEEGGGRGTPDQTYALGRFRLREGEALVMDVAVPPCTYASAVLWNRFGQSIDVRRHRSTINHRQMVVADGRTARIVVAHEDPGAPNWLDTGGRAEGTVFWRFLLAEAPPEPIDAQVVPVAMLAGLAAAGLVGAEEPVSDV